MSFASIKFAKASKQMADQLIYNADFRESKDKHT